MLENHLGCDAAGRHQVAGLKVVRYDGFKLIRGISAAINHDHVITQEQAGSAAVGLFESFVLTESGHFWPFKSE